MTNRWIDSLTTRQITTGHWQILDEDGNVVEDKLHSYQTCKMRIEDMRHNVQTWKEEQDKC